MKNLAQFLLADGSVVAVELKRDEGFVDGYEDVGLLGDRHVQSATTLDHAVDRIRGVASAVMEPLTRTQPRPDEVEVEFQVTLDVEAGAVIARSGSGAHFTVRLRWTADQSDMPSVP
ncbi:hypothetical protein SAMN05446589_2607 [Streptomyces sp. OV198]|jgi:predicted oxidoreductase|uniref:CU044_2847 family protein n=1 Tax=Streptomyces TaxID=1883 RepID=UPI000BDC786D|nr:CU044_2847 family protein [Streptomyces sp. OV198]SOE64925.1 hypothetical protein SAMN05446589_2607 [Streptomyces sp. OV198]